MKNKNDTKELENYLEDHASEFEDTGEDMSPIVEAAKRDVKKRKQNEN